MWGGLSGKERTALKRDAFHANGTKFGRRRKVDDTEHIATAKRMKVDGHTGKDIAKYLGVSRATRIDIWPRTTPPDQVDADEDGQPPELGMAIRQCLTGQCLTG